MSGTLSHSPGDLFDDALAAVEREHRRTAAERDAFVAFIERVSDISPNARGTETGLTSVRIVSPRSDSLGTIREAYESTVMDVPHHEVEYGETFAESVREEFGPDIATLLTSGQRFEHHHKRAVLSTAKEAKELREELAGVLEEERSSIEELRNPVCTVTADVDSLEATDPEAQPADLLDGYRRRASVLGERCHELIGRRQSKLVGRRRAIALPISGPDIPTYVYRGLPTSYPVVAVLTESIERAATCEAAFEAALTSHRERSDASVDQP